MRSATRATDSAGAFSLDTARVAGLAANENAQGDANCDVVALRGGAMTSYSFARHVAPDSASATELALAPANPTAFHVNGSACGVGDYPGGTPYQVVPK